MRWPTSRQPAAGLPQSRQARRRPQPGSFASTPCRTACRARMQDDYPANGGVRLRRVCDDAEAAARSGRLFLCRRCRSQVIVCSCCDRGQVYCGAECSRQVRRQAQRAAAERYAESPRGRRCHADRSRRYRARREIVTHQGSPKPPAGGVVTAGAMAISRDDAAPTGRARTHCRWCGRPCLPQLRQGFLRRRDRRRSRVGHARTEHEPPW